MRSQKTGGTTNTIVQDVFEATVTDPDIWKRGRGGRQCISLVVIYRKRKQQTICVLYGKRRLIEKILSPHRPPPF